MKVLIVVFRDFSSISTVFCYWENCDWIFVRKLKMRWELNELNREKSLHDKVKMIIEKGLENVLQFDVKNWSSNDEFIKSKKINRQNERTYISAKIEFSRLITTERPCTQNEFRNFRNLMDFWKTPIEFINYADYGWFAKGSLPKKRANTLILNNSAIPMMISILFISHGCFWQLNQALICNLNFEIFNYHRTQICHSFKWSN